MNEKTSRNFTLLTMFILSLISNTVAPLMTTIQDTFSITVATSSMIPVMTTVGVLISNLSGSLLIAQLGLKTFLNISLIEALIGSIIFLISKNFTMVLIAVFFIGASTGSGFMSLSSITAHLSEKYKNFGTLNGFFGVGGIVAPFLAGIFIKNNINFRTIYISYIVILIIMMFSLNTRKIIKNIKYEPINIIEASTIISKKTVILPLLLFLLYSGTEISVITWSGNFLNTEIGLTKSNSSIYLSIFWILFTFARFVTNYLNKKITSLKTIQYFSILFIINLILLLTTKNPIFFILIGLSFGPIFPSAQNYSSNILNGRELGLFNGLTFAATGLGALIISPIMGIIGESNLYMSFSVPFLTFAIIVILTKILHK
ncbi:MFS transporter [Oceanotoga sp. DSM 15011]|jgi:fucose permease|uniref:Fucose permease n=1 Tax=Oceanotoga teriensis TaxID=515440 RepID=A0AA45C7M2_9BACT|nr:MULTISPECIES: MFS transporter [Oceanotoga]MDO7976286.1 MFS transporter [Oceanotoga teriensis]PWJ95483.1 fucose permease [Oceanotoga teriensis]UYP01122.1 MFS transporter [Oceanotoga sp. DSM 15011]